MTYNERRREQSQHTEEAIFQAALELFRAHGFDKVSIRDICQSVGITTGAFYHHFKSKEELLIRGFSPLDTYMERAMADHRADAPLQRLWALLSTYAGFVEEQGWELISRYYQRRLASADATPMDPTRYTLRFMLECLRQARDQGLLAQDCSPEWAADFFFRHFRGIVIDWIIHRGTYPLLPKLEQDYILFRGIFEIK